MSLSHADYRLAMRARALTLAVTPAAVAFSRASTATYHDVNGVVQTAAIDTYRGAHYVGATLTALYEAAATNLATRSEDLGNAAWANLGAQDATVTANTDVAPDGTTTADTITDGSGALTMGRSLLITVANDSTAYTFSVYLKKTVGALSTYPAVAIIMAGGVYIEHRMTVNTTTGATVTASAGSPTVTGESIVSVGSYWRVSVTLGNNASGNVSMYPDIIPAVATTFTTTNEAAATGSVIAWGAQVETGTTATSYIPTVAATVTRAADLGDVFGTTTTGYTRAAGSFVTDGYRAGMEVTPVGFTETAAQTIKSVSALAITVHGTLTAQGLAAGRTLTVGLPATRVWENTEKRPAAPAPYVGERYFPGTLIQDTIGPNGYMEATALYQLDLYVAQDTGPVALDGYADALAVHFTPRTSLTTGDGTVVRVGMGSAGPTRSSVGKSEFAGFAVLSVSFPLVVRVLNTI